MLLAHAEVVRNLKNVTVDNKVKSIIRHLFYFTLFLNINACKTYTILPHKSDIPTGDFDAKLSGELPDYSKINYWAEHPKKEKHYASLPKKYLDTLNKENPNIDAFFIHREIFLLSLLTNGY